MGIWIRSQNKELLFFSSKLQYTNNGSKHLIISIENVNKKVTTALIIGEYPTEERAIEVLDEIHQAVSTQKLAKFYGSAHGSMGATDFVFEMPSE